MTPERPADGVADSWPANNETPAWMRDAACRGVDSDLFFAERWGAADAGAKAKAVCATFEVREPCLTYALERPEIHGIWGGLSPVQRRAERRRRGMGGAKRFHPDTCACPTCGFKSRWRAC